MIAALLARQHASTFTCCALARTLLGIAPAGALPTTLPALTLHALVSSLFAGGISWLLALCSWLLDLSSPNATRQTVRPAPALLASNHNSRESFLAGPALCRCSQPALQASSQPIDENAPCANRLIDCTSRTENRPTGLLGAVNSMSYTIKRLCSASIHNCWLSILKWDERWKNATSIFSLFIPINTRPYQGGFVKGKCNGLDKPSLIWHPCWLSAPWSAGCVTLSESTRPSRQSTHPSTHTPGPVSSACINATSAASALPAAVAARLLAIVQGAEQVTRPLLDTSLGVLVVLVPCSCSSSLLLGMTPAGALCNESEVV